MDLNVTKNKITITATDPIHSGEFKVNQCNFTFSESYTNDLIKKAIFTRSKDKNSYEVTIENDTCDIPVEVLQYEGIIEIGVYAYEEQNNELVLRYSPSPVRIKISRGSYNSADEGTTYIPADEVVTEDELNEAINGVNTTINTIKRKTVVDSMNYNNKIITYSISNIGNTSVISQTIDLANDFYDKTEIDDLIGDIGTLLDNINRMVI